MLFTVSGTVAVAVALANVVALRHAVGIARLRDLRALARIRLFLDARAPALLARLPEISHVPFDLRAASALLSFSALAIAVYLVLAWAVAALVAPLLVPLAREPASDDRPWPDAYPLAVAAASLLPLVVHRLSLWTDLGRGALWASGGAIVLVAGYAVARLVWTRAAARRLVRGASVVAATGALAAALGAGAALLAPDDHDVGTRTVPPASTPNVLLVSIDTLRPDHLGSYGYGRDTSPTLDALAAAGARFTTVVSPTSWTLPAHMTLLTALPPEVHGVVNDDLRLDASVVTLAEVLQTRGYATAGFVSGPYLDAGYGFARGFDHYDDYSAVRISRPAVHRARTSPAVASALTRWLDGWSTTAPHRPFFAFVHLWDVHYDFNPPPPYDRLFDPGYRGDPTRLGLDFENGDAVYAGMPARDLAHVVALYDGEIRYTDDWVGRMLDGFRRRTLLDDTVVIVTSDHGEEFYEHGKKGHRNALYDESIRVPLIIRFPRRVPAGTVVERQVRTIDIAPTILALTDTPSPPDFGLDPTLAPYGGQSLLPLVARGAPTMPALPAFADLQPHGISAVRHPDAKLITSPFGDPTQELFDLEKDPGEHTNLAPTDPATTTTLQNELTTWHDTARLAAKRAESAPMSPEHKAALKALGYVQ